MISLLETGKYSPELMVIREVAYSDSQTKKIYQTVCLAKLSHKAEVPVGCIITNLSQFLEKVEAINFPFKINFHYIPEELTGMDIKFDFGKLLFFGLIAYIIWKVRAGMKGKMGGGIGDMLNLKKYEPIKPENIQTVFKDVAGMH